jgi:hypothetical protein
VVLAGDRDLFAAAFGGDLAVPPFISTRTHVAAEFASLRSTTVAIRLEWPALWLTVRPREEHPLSGREMRELRRHQRESAFVSVSERGAPLSAPGFSRMVERAAVAADLGINSRNLVFL